MTVPADGSNDSSGDACCNYTTGIWPFTTEHNCSNAYPYACCLGNKNSAGGRCIMSSANSGLGTRTFDAQCAALLAGEEDLQCDSTSSSTQASPAAAGQEDVGEVVDVGLIGGSAGWRFR